MDITVVVNPRSAEVSVYAGHMQDAQLRIIAEVMSEGKPFTLHQTLPDRWLLYIRKLDNLFLIISHQQLIETVPATEETHGRQEADPPTTS
jgi:hypothetical protein